MEGSEAQKRDRGDGNASLCGKIAKMHVQNRGGTGGGQKVVLVGFSDGKFRQPRGDGNGRPKLILQSTSVYLKRQC